jgi:hypothetical protein
MLGLLRCGLLLISSLGGLQRSGSPVYLSRLKLGPTSEPSTWRSLVSLQTQLLFVVEQTDIPLDHIRTHM